MRAFNYERSGLTTWAEREFQTPMTLAWMYLAMDMEEDAKSVYGYIAEQLEPQVAAGVRHPETLNILAEARYGIGDMQGAIDTLHLAIDHGGYYMLFCCEDYLSSSVKRQREEWDEESGYTAAFWAEELAGDPDVELARSRMRAIVENQRSNILALLEQNDMEQLLAPLIEGSGETS